MIHWRHLLLSGVFMAAVVTLSARVIFLAVTERDFLQDEGDRRALSETQIPGMRGLIYDRNGRALAVSTPVSAIVVNPSLLRLDPLQLTELARLLDLPASAVANRIAEHSQKQYLYLRRHLGAERSAAIQALRIDHLWLEREYRRFYPAGEVAAHVVGMTNIDDRGLEGLELSYDRLLQGRAGSKTVLRDRYGDIIRDIEYQGAAQFGQDMVLSLDLRLQYIAYRELKAAVATHQAVSGSLVMVDVSTGEILALVNQPSFNPNDISGYRNSMRNRVVTDAYEPGSTIKPFAALAALESGRYTPETPIDTAPGYFWIGKKMIQDPVDRKTLTLAQAIQKSSQVAIAKLALALGEDAVFDVLTRAGLGNPVGTGLPGEAIGFLSETELRYPLVRATLAYGYGLTVTPLQMASAYLTLARHGERLPLTITRRDRPLSVERIFDADLAESVLSMMELVTAQEGTASEASVDGYRVAGKTGTARLVGAQGYDDERHVAWFAGVAPVTNPKIVMVVVINEAKSGEIGGGRLAAPVFSRVAERSLRLLGIRPDQVDTRLAQVPSPNRQPVWQEDTP
ncbi:MAG: penicillin-binding protein 2 [Gammaproteobacteria bacterium TMED134]|nr:MAG: penicillin-binding protein 2 [Gammaproteobacteria bacterium TMED134]RZO71433.1 MAG: penicillin-binding protein 2 [OM182 bacterium]